jgi:hypothetical protein
MRLKERIRQDYAHCRIVADAVDSSSHDGPVTIGFESKDGTNFLRAEYEMTFKATAPAPMVEGQWRQDAETRNGTAS